MFSYYQPIMASSLFSSDLSVHDSLPLFDHMSISDTRPPWLPNNLETLVFEKGLTIRINNLRESRYHCEIVGQVLDAVLQQLPASPPPSDFEVRMARQHLAVELQHILKKWCEEGLAKTLGGSFLGMISTGMEGVEGLGGMGSVGGSTGGNGGGRKDLLVRSFRPPSLSPSSPSLVPSFIDRPDLQVYRGGGGDSTSSALVPMKRASDDDDQALSNKSGKFYTGGEAGGEKDFRCPYNVRDPSSHTECANKRFPNPRKLKEHIWRFTKPFKCPTCNEGFGREKTKAIHCQQRKVKCVPSERDEYDNSYEQHRDRQIDRAKNTPEIIGIFEEYDRNFLTTYGPNPDDAPETDSPGSDDSGSMTPVVTTPVVTLPSQHWPQIPQRSPAPILRIPQPAEKSGYPTPPGDRNPFSPHHDISQQSLGMVGECNSPFQSGPMVGFPEAGTTAHDNNPFNTDGMFSPSSSAQHQQQQQHGFPLHALDIPEIVISEMNPTMNSPMTPAGFRPSMFPLEMDMSGSSPTQSRRTSMALAMGSRHPPSRQQQQQQHQRQQQQNQQHQHQHQHHQQQQHQQQQQKQQQQYQEPDAFDSMQQGEVYSQGYGSIPPVRFRMKF
ncbi:hypothetical protein BZA05DRAFT_456284 [Tricharina praecox]|uniref:uncharacterized protein n=1 Tax=Tricharina praecox TaxID=43433 RepID=UPI00221E6A29|nr:uncharacterized protein BZA05DRAFT_456284 [Tricharina praecox]KAI5857701.1 hypothetical protein BZA05DRAFT_456284 [Tricharina praecox]